MQEALKIATVQTLVDQDSQATDDVVRIYLSIASERILNRLYPFDDTKETSDIPERYDYKICQLASRMFLRRGAEGEITHNENGVNRTYASVDDSDILDSIMPYAKVSL